MEKDVQPLAGRVEEGMQYLRPDLEALPNMLAHTLRWFGGTLRLSGHGLTAIGQSSARNRVLEGKIDAGPETAGNPIWHEPTEPKGPGSIIRSCVTLSQMLFSHVAGLWSR
jgi:hypothetical protein